MDRSEVYTLEPAPLSPKITSPDLTPTKTPSITNKTTTTLPSSVKKQLNNNNCFTPNSSFLKLNQTVACLETLHENSHNNSITTNFDQSYDLTQTPLSVVKRKRKFSPENSTLEAKRKCDKSYSEKRKKVSDFFKTPINYFSNRRRTIDATTFNQSLNESISSTSGLFNVETINNLSCINNKTNNQTPNQTTKKFPKKSLFTRTFSSSKFVRTKSKKKVDLNATKLSYNENIDDGNEKLNASCFPDFSLHPTTSHSELARASRRTSAVVLTSFHTVFFYINYFLHIFVSKIF